MKTSDFFIVGGGIVGVTLALELRRRFPDQSIVLCEKEVRIGTHASTRNSGVIHSGIYYDPDSVKAKVCHEGAKRMIDFHETHNLPIRKMGKLLVCPEETMADQIDVLMQRAGKNGLEAFMIDDAALSEMEPEARSAGGRAIFVPITSVGDPAATMAMLEGQLKDAGIKIIKGAGFRKRERDGSFSLTNGERYETGYFINAAGGHADRVAHAFGLGLRYVILPFRGLYWRLAPNSGIRLNHLVYPVPDLRFPFLGIHTTTSIDGSTYLGPTASPGFGREHYRGIAGVNPGDMLNNAFHAARQILGNKNGFRRLAFQEIKRLTKRGFVSEARKILPRLSLSMLQPTRKAGIRAQILDRRSGRLINDFLAVKGDRSLHVLNAISPAWTCSFSLAEHICGTYLEV